MVFFEEGEIAFGEEYRAYPALMHNLDSIISVAYFPESITIYIYPVHIESRQCYGMVGEQLYKKEPYWNR